MSKESVIDISGPVDQASPQKVTTLPKRQRNAQFSGPVSPSNMTTVFPRSQAAVDEILDVNDPVLSRKLFETGLMLAYAAEIGKKLKPGVIATLTNAREALARHAWTKAIAEQFWPAYGQLCAAIKPVTGESLTTCGSNNIIRKHRLCTICLVSLILPLSILMFINAHISDEISDRIKENNALVVRLHDQLLGIQPGHAQNDVVAQLQELATSNRSLYSLASVLNRFILTAERDPLSDIVDKRQALQLPVPLTDPASAGFDKIKTYQDVRTYAKDVQQMNVMIYGAITAYLLPILYALLGACAFALRSLSQQIRARTYTPTYADFARIIIAVIAGLVVGLFNNFTQGISLSPLAVAFLVGYGVEIFFSFLDTFLETLRKVRSRQLPQRA